MRKFNLQFSRGGGIASLGASLKAYRESSFLIHRNTVRNTFCRIRTVAAVLQAQKSYCLQFELEIIRCSRPVCRSLEARKIGGDTGESVVTFGGGISFNPDGPRERGRERPR